MANQRVRIPAFSESEHRERFARARRALRDAGLAACVCFAPEHIYYFAGYDAHTQFSLQALVFGPDDEEPTFVFRDVDRANADETSWVRDLSLYHHGQHDPADLIVAAVRKRAAPQARVGVCLNSYALPGAFALRLVKALAPSEISDATLLVERQRYVKSPQEIAYIREAASYAERGLRRLREVARPGLTEIQLAGEIEAAMREAGSEYSAMPTWLSCGRRTHGSHKTPTSRVIERGDAIKTEFAGVCRRYHAVTMQTLWIGSVNDADRRIYDTSLAALRAGAQAIAIGAPVARAEQAAFGTLRDGGLSVASHARFGYGVSAAYPPSWLEGLDITGESGDTFAAHMAFVLHTTVYAKEGLGVLIGGAYITTERGLELLSGGDLELTVL